MNEFVELAVDSVHNEILPLRTQILPYAPPWSPKTVEVFLFSLRTAWVSRGPSCSVPTVIGV